MASLGQWTFGFVSLLLLPVLGVLALTKRRASPGLSFASAAWAAFGAVVFVAGPPAWLVGTAGARTFWLRWAVGLFLLLAITAVARLRERKKSRVWIELGLALMAVLAFARGLWLFLDRFAG
ncbi:MAG: hypothetical protein EPO68_17675 [Planctomycetota bacterium]|nr:MAG: hypothetical protein EPO68_17675 [Planctomycetota bacterium]